MTDRPLFIVFEGLDGSGTSTQAQLLVEFLGSTRSHKSRLTAEPSSGPVGQLIRTAFSGRLKLMSDTKRFDRQLAYLFAADRHDHLYNDTDGVMKLLSEGYSVVSTRYIASSYVYHCVDDEDIQFVHSLNDNFPLPDLMIYIDVPLDVSIDRLGRRSNLDTYENIEKLRIVKSNYETFFGTYDAPYIRVSGDQPAGQIHAAIREAISNL